MTDHTGQFVVFRVADEILACALDNVDEVADPIEVTRLPATVDWFQGLAPRKGHLVPVSDLGEFVNKTPSRSAETAKWLMVKASNETFAVVVDEVIGLLGPDKPDRQSPNSLTQTDQVHSHQNCDETSGESKTEDSTSKVAVSPFSALVRRQVAIDGASLPLLDLPALLDQPQFISIGTLQP